MLGFCREFNFVWAEFLFLRIEKSLRPPGRRADFEAIFRNSRFTFFTFHWPTFEIVLKVLSTVNLIEGVMPHPLIHSLPWVEILSDDVLGHAWAFSLV